MYKFDLSPRLRRGTQANPIKKAATVWPRLFQGKQTIVIFSGATKSPLPSLGLCFAYWRAIFRRRRYAITPLAANNVGPPAQGVGEGTA